MFSPRGKKVLPLEEQKQKPLYDSFSPHPLVRPYRKDLEYPGITKVMIQVLNPHYVLEI